MIRNLIVILSILTGTASTGIAQDTADDVLDAVAQAIGEADVDGIMDVAASRVDVSIFGSGKNYSRTQAKFVLSKFFSSHHPTSFRLTASSKTSRGRFVEGLYYANSSRKPLHIYIRLQKRDDHWELKEFQVERPQR